LYRAAHPRDLGSGEMGNGLSVIAIPQWYREWTLKYGKRGFIAASKTWDRTQDAADLSGRVHIVTGSNAGIGFEAAKELARRKGIVHMLCRNAERGEAARAEIAKETGNQQVFLHVVDVASIKSVRDFAQSFMKTNQKVDMLVNNAGILVTDRENSVDGIESCLAVALGGTYLLTGLLLPALEAAAAGNSHTGRGIPAVVVNVTSAGMYLAKADVSDLQMTKRKDYDGFLQYCRVKRAQVLHICAYGSPEYWSAQMLLHTYIHTHGHTHGNT
jgi:dehydrogenase/reductase SDR family protein 12